MQLPILSSRSFNVSSHPDEWAGKETNVLVLNYTLICPLACDFCCYSCHPKRTEKMDFALARRLIAEAAGLGVFSSIGFTGGEPLLFEDELSDLSDDLARYGLRFTIATAAHWAKDRQHGRELLRRLAANGLSRLNISYDPSHQRFVPRDAVINAATSAVELGIETHVVGTFYSPDDSVEKSLPELAGVVNIQSKLVAKVGRASCKSISRSAYGLATESLDCLACYRHIYHDMVIFFDGNVYPCCSTFNRATPGLVLGNVLQEPLAAIWTRLDGSEMFRVMKRKGFGEVYRLVAKYDPTLVDQLPKPEEVLGPCSLCNGIFKDPSVATRINDVFAHAEMELVNQIVDRLTHLIGEEEVNSMLTSAITKSKEIHYGEQAS
jgi:MoaA/NifB/PqqE/SkfB family radical SAM enzyme